jgi:hypothetical protein
MIRFTFDDLERAHAEWRCNCGPAAFAAICGLTLNEARNHFPEFHGWTNPTTMLDALMSAGMVWRIWKPTYDGHGIMWPRYGLARIQWEGPWTTAIGTNPRWAYRHTHWVGAGPTYGGDGKPNYDDVCIWDINQMSERDRGWAPLQWWTRKTAPDITSSISRATGGWRITHAIEVERSGAAS